MAPSGTPTGGRYRTSAVEKGFVVLNLYVGLRVAIGAARSGSAGAYDVLGPLHGNVSDWNRRAADVEIFGRPATSRCSSIRSPRPRRLAAAPRCVQVQRAPDL